jgi:hypothetical protein
MREQPSSTSIARCRSMARALLVLSILLTLGTAPVLADDPPAGEPPVETGELPTEAPPPPTAVPTEPPPPPTAIPTDSPTEIPPTDVPPTDIPPTEVPPTVEPTVEPTTVPVASPTVEPTLEPTETPEPCEGPDVSRVLPLLETSNTGFGAANSNGVSYPALTDAFTITISMPAPDACIMPAWVITMTAGAMTEPGGGWIPASAITFAGVTSGPDAPVPVGTSLDSPVVILRGTANLLSATDGILTIRVLVELSPPPGTPPGSYRGEIAVDAVVVP